MKHVKHCFTPLSKENIHARHCGSHPNRGIFLRPFFYEIEIRHFFIGIASLFFCFSAHAAADISGQWMCSSSPIKIQAFMNVPAGKLLQNTAYAADKKGNWVSNSVMVFEADQGGGKYRLNTTSTGVHGIMGNVYKEKVNIFEIKRPYDQSTPFAKSVSQPLNAMILAVMRKSLARQYRLLEINDKRYTMQPLAGKTANSAVRMSCSKLH